MTALLVAAIIVALNVFGVLVLFICDRVQRVQRGQRTDTLAHLLAADTARPHTRVHNRVGGQR